MNSPPLATNHWWRIIMNCRQWWGLATTNYYELSPVVATGGTIHYELWRLATTGGEWWRAVATTRQWWRVVATTGQWWRVVATTRQWWRL